MYKISRSPQNHRLTTIASSVMLSIISKPATPKRQWPVSIEQGESSPFPDAYLLDSNITVLERDKDG